MSSFKLRVASRYMNDLSANSTASWICSAESRASAARFRPWVEAISAAILSRQIGSVTPRVGRHITGEIIRIDGGTHA